MSKKSAPKTAPVAAPAPTPAPAAATPAKKAPKAAAAKAEVTVPTVAAPVAAAAPSTPAETRTAEAILASVAESLKALQTELTGRVRAAIAEASAATKAVKREVRDSKKKRRVDPSTLSAEERAKYDARRANNAFLKARGISDELAAFMGIAAGSKRSQTQVTKFIAEYVKTHSCFDPQFKRRIIPNAALAKLLRVTDKNEVNYLNLQTYLKVHFKKE